MKFRHLTPQEEDKYGLSEPRNCGICKTGKHFCGGCGVDLEHEEGSTCIRCWRFMIEDWPGYE